MLESPDLKSSIARWAEVAVSHAVTRRSEDPPGLIATVEGVEGAWGFGDTNHKALEDLESVLRDWAAMKLRDGDKDIPHIKGVDLVPAV
ncbi:MAG: hypothetical protein OXI56_09175 [bacterium]|nr:hypothetical protein [bacterium]MDE0601947.1 hypothetical protein [bacterium]